MSTFIFLQWLLSPSPSATAGDIYHYVAPDGTVVFTNVPTDPRFRRLKWGSIILEGAIARHSARHNLDPALLRAVIKAESDFDPSAVSRAGAVGLMQLMPDTAALLQVQNPYDPEENIGGGARYLRYLLDRFNGNLRLALAAYNAGESRVEQYRTLPPFRETHSYVAKVLRFYESFLLPKSPSSAPRGHPLHSRSNGSPTAAFSVASAR